MLPKKSVKFESQIASYKSCESLLCTKTIMTTREMSGYIGADCDEPCELFCHAECSCLHITVTQNSHGQSKLDFHLQSLSPCLPKSQSFHPKLRSDPPAAQILTLSKGLCTKGRKQATSSKAPFRRSTLANGLLLLVIMLRAFVKILCFRRMVQSLYVISNCLYS
jgi:hypothetical protein